MNRARGLDSRNISPCYLTKKILAINSLSVYINARSPSNGLDSRITIPGRSPRLGKPDNPAVGPHRNGKQASLCKAHQVKRLRKALLVSSRDAPAWRGICVDLANLAPSSHQANESSSGINMIPAYSKHHYHSPCLWGWLQSNLHTLIR